MIAVLRAIHGGQGARTGGPIVPADVARCPGALTRLATAAWSMLKRLDALRRAELQALPSEYRCGPCC